MINTLAELYGQMGFLGSLITGIIIIVFIIGFYVNILIRRCYLTLSQELAAYCDGDINEFKSGMLSWVTEEYKAGLSAQTEYINAPVIIDMALEAYQKPCLIGESFLKKVNGLLVTLGLFGTFVGLTSAIGEIGNMMSQTSGEMLMTEAGINTFKVLISSFRGMSVAFITSLFGIGFSIILNIVTTLIGSLRAKNLFLTQLEEYLSVRLYTKSIEKRNQEIQNRKDENQIVAQILQDSISLFSKTVNSLIEEIDYLKTFNKELRENLCQANNYIASFNQSLNKTSEAFSSSSIQISGCSNELKNTVIEIKNHNRRLESMSGIFSELSIKLDESSRDRQIYLKTINEIPDRILNYTEAAVAKIEKEK